MGEGGVSQGGDNDLGMLAETIEKPQNKKLDLPSFVSLVELCHHVLGYGVLGNNLERLPSEEEEQKHFFENTLKNICSWLSWQPVTMLIITSSLRCSRDSLARHSAL